MCLIVFGWKAHPKYPLILAANRDEFYGRPTTTAHWWKDSPEIFGGRDLKAGGTWMGITKSGRIAAVTNFRQFPITESYETSRGSLVTDFLNGNESPEKYLNWLNENGHKFEGFNLIFGNTERLFYYGNRSQDNGEITPGVHGLSNHLLNTPWPKVERAKNKLKSQLEKRADKPEDYIDLLKDKEKAPTRQLPDTGIGLDKEKELSSMFIDMDGYGTRASYVTLISNEGEVNFLEKSHLPKETTLQNFKVKSG